MSTAELLPRPGHYLQRRPHDLTRPSLSDPTRCVLLGLKHKLELIIAQLPPGERILDYGCGIQPYRGLVSQKYIEYLGADLEATSWRT